MRRKPWMGISVAVVAALVSAAVTGCSRPTAAIDGTVSYRGQPVPNGVVAVFVGESQVVTGWIDEGRFMIRGAPLGEGVVTVECDTPPDPSIKHLPDEKIVPIDNPAAPKPAVPPVAIPTRYRNPRTSPLRIALVAGAQRFDIALLDE